jgi:hypothetical protein
MRQTEGCGRNSRLPKASSLRVKAGDCLLEGVAYGYLTTLIVMLGVFVGREFVKPPPGRPPAADTVASMANWDGIWYRGIAERGYWFHPHQRSPVAFFPAYPLLGRAVAAVTGLRADLALVVVSQLCFLATCVMAAAYVRDRFGEPGRAADLPTYVLLAMGLFPAGFFLRMAYSESLFLLLTVLVLYAIQRRWHPLAVALLTGVATAARPTGAALLLPLALYLWHESPSRWAFVRRLALYGPIGCWGLAAYMGFLYAEFDEPLAFVVAQQNWQIRPETPLAQRLLDLATLEPVLSVYDSGSPGHWGRVAPVSPFLSLPFANPIYLIAAAALLVVGGCKRWLNRYELWLGAGLLLIPYATRGHEMCLASAGRFASVAFPCYLVAAQLLCRLGYAAVAVLAVAAALLGAYAALFAAGYCLI